MALAALKVVDIAIIKVNSDSTVKSKWDQAKIALEGAIDKVKFTNTKRDIVKDHNKGRIKAWDAEIESENAMWAAEDDAWQAYQLTDKSTTLNKDIKFSAFRAWEITREAARATIMTQRRPSTHQAKQKHNKHNKVEDQDKQKKDNLK
jgi:hypothetical protein